MEEAIIRLVAEHNWPGLRVDLVEVTRREHTGVGRYTYLIDRAGQQLVDGSYGANAHFIDMDGVPNGLFFTVEVADSGLTYLEVVSCGADSWDGFERKWRIG